jgi:hypothetical protein
MEATNNFAVFESAAKRSRVIPINSRPGIWRASNEAEREPRSVVGLVVAVGLSLSVWALVGVALLA